MNKKFYITTTLPYVNAEPHIGFALEIVQADIIARYQKEVLGKEIVFNTGTDEHGLKIYRKAQEEGMDPQKYTDEYAAEFNKLREALNLSYTNFIRTTDAHHMQAAQEFWRKCDENGYIYKDKYQVKYCVGCELEKTESDLVDGKCPVHPNLEIEIMEEENYFFKFSAFQKPLLDFYNTHPEFVVPDFRFHEIKKFVQAGLADFSISRLRAKMPWGVPVPGDDTQVMYVWFDALINYISTLGWPENSDKFNEFWGTNEHLNAVQIAGKDNLRQQSCMWQAMLMAAGLPNSKQIIIHGFITSGGQKMSKSLGNVIEPYAFLDLLQKKGLSKEQATDALRYFLAREISTFEDSDFTWERFLESYNANLANGLGNMVSRVTKMINTYFMGDISGVVFESGNKEKANLFMFSPSLIASWRNNYNQLLLEYKIQYATDMVWETIKFADMYIAKYEPFKLIKEDKDKTKKVLWNLFHAIEFIARCLIPIMPNTSKQIFQALQKPNIENIPHLFPRIEY